MIYRAIGLMSGSSLDGLDIVFAEFQHQGGQWSYEILETDCYTYSGEWTGKLQQAIHLGAKEYLLLHAEYGHYLGQQVNQFIDAHRLHYKVAVIASHGHTTFHLPGQKMTAQLGDGAAIAAVTQLPVVSDLRAMDVAFGGQGAPIVPMGEKLLLPGYYYFLNVGGIANVSGAPRTASAGWGFDVCPANRVLNMLANEIGKDYDEGGQLAASGTIQKGLLDALNSLEYYKKAHPKSLANDFGTDVVYPLIKNHGLTIHDALRTYTEHIAIQVNDSIAGMRKNNIGISSQQLLCTGGGALNTFLAERLSWYLQQQQIEVVVPDSKLVNYKEALIMAFLGVLRWRQEYTVLSSVTGAARDSIGGALWTGQEA